MDFQEFLSFATEAVEEHPEVARRKLVDDNVKKGLSPALSHEKVCGEVDLRDSGSKGKLAATLARLQKGAGPRSPETDEGSKSIYAQDREKAKEENGSQ